MSVKPCRIVLGLISTIIAVPSAQAQSPDPRATDSVQFFATFCVGSAGTRDRALTVLGNGNELARRLPDDVVRQAQGGLDGGVGWTVRSPNNAELMLDYTASGICGLRIREADETSVRDAFEAVMKGVAKGAGAELTSEKPEVRQVDGARTIYKAYSFPMGVRTAHFGLTTADRPVGAQQHFMTFGFVQ
uniref:NMCC_0638 family (lipo)protein n=1 Tax=Edaphosphingomonas laterariae TaxID=861865 RepID=UPI001181A93C|nr:hypothetical protein [Sphingomonas laterariae]